MLIPPRPLPVTDQLYLRIRYNLKPYEMEQYHRSGMSRAEIVRMMERQAPAAFGVPPRPDFN